MANPSSAAHIDALVRRIPALFPLRASIHDALELLLCCIANGGTIMVCGNGGSAADAEHIVGELMKGFLLPRQLTPAMREALASAFPEEGAFLAGALQRGIRAVSLVSGVALPTAFANDVNAECAFAQQVLALGRPADLVWGISTSGMSANVNHAFRVARAFGMKTLGLTGKNGGDMAALCDVELRMPANETYLIQELHLPVYHTLCAALEAELFG